VSSTWPCCTSCARILPGSMKYKCFRIVARACNCRFRRNCYIDFTKQSNTALFAWTYQTWNNVFLLQQISFSRLISRKNH
jgi:hypothetical protein